MEEEVKKKRVPRWATIILIIAFTFYVWYFMSTLLIPLAEFLNISALTYLVFYKMVGFPPAIIALMLCVSLISVIIVFLEFNEQTGPTKIFIAESITFMLYFIIPIVATIILIISLAFGISNVIPTETRISQFLSDLFLFSSYLFLMTAVLDIATQKIIAVNTKKGGKL